MTRPEPVKFGRVSAHGHVAINTSVFEDLGDRRTRVITTCLFHTTEEGDGMLNSGLEQGLNLSYGGLDKVLASL